MGVLYKRCVIRHRLLLTIVHTLKTVCCLRQIAIAGRDGEDICDTNTVAQANVKERLAQDEEDLGYIEPSRKSCISWVETVVV